ncbi:glutathione S-transferase [Gluconacetobacter liquefaciens]|uniref:Glutathione S-transferase n=1 Tax=Gluconacetobacter liquefaciens TaxID=89584 RepID=A0A370G406_GLULI|nr:glutathione S-transferase family protein [Gluconacetobacter liquefaciens]MBB2186049.1 glutathione S-transferase family protein [Gluconacetobacter liquefaciens]RDI38581.1 glutathione S-transferase [Gluconacetobacter liquefaciens]GBR08037.1 glutathione S-transferase [Gluconacetobacter liquefaciens NRIC 0522]GEB36996.1 glutathione S-transferase [Gluconacetobacter liquefaciens]
MADGKLYIGTRRYSSWSLRGWLVVHLAGLDVEDVVIPLAGGGGTTAIKAVSPNGMVPYLEHRGARVWESLAIGEYCAEITPALWPSDRLARAHARSIAAEMHAGFRPLRMALPMNLGRHGRPLAGGLADDVQADIARIDALLSGTRAAFGQGGPYLFGADLTVADAMFAPVIARFLGYGVQLSTVAADYAALLRAHPLMARWYDDAAREPEAWHLERFETLA